MRQKGADQNCGPRPYSFGIFGTHCGRGTWRVSLGYMQMRIQSAEELQGVADRILSAIEARHWQKAAVVALSGDLGAGKTSLTKVLAKKLGVNASVKSPTFVIMGSYDISGPFKHLIHIDAYRLEKESELEALSFSALLEDKSNLIFIEWPEKVQGLIPKDAMRVSLEHVSENERIINLEE